MAKKRAATGRKTTPKKATLPKKKKPSELRKKAEKQLKSDVIPIETLSDGEVRKLAHELQVYQIELEMQNDELREAQLLIEESRQKYLDLFDFAPVGYFTVNEKGLILEANLTGAAMLRTTRSLLAKEPISKFIVSEDQDKYYLYHRNIYDGKQTRACELKMVRNDGTVFHVQLECTVLHDSDEGSRQCRTVLTDITERKFAESKVDAAHEEIKKYKENLEAIFKSIRDGIILVDRELKIVEFNESARRICGFPDINNARGKKFELLHKYCEGECIDALTETKRTKLPAERDRFECFNIKMCKCLVSVATYPLFDNKDEFNGCVIVVRDETRLAILESTLQERHQFHNIVGKNEELQKIFSLIETLSDTPTTVLITGENGTGKRLVAEALHYHSKGARNTPFVVVSCSSLSDSVLESELFGHVKGSFTGAISDRMGRFQKAEGGTIFLDEIGDISNTMQLRLLRVLEERAFEKVGDSNTIKANVRVIAATNQDLRKKISEGKFREDLYHRLKVVELKIPPLRERYEDIPLLVEHFIQKLRN
ncbi:Nitrogen fixation protein VnfA [Candidatus Brocadiaceae bacterium S225]|nr:Nitrogen fixation protein VnfA [Candidatus Brocadiaceae bacterium S225]